MGGLEGMGAQVLILDELDSGVGGRLGAAVGQLLRAMVRGRNSARPPASQIICVSHLPQVMYRLHFFVRNIDSISMSFVD